jgi:hypothetical protein
MRIVHVLRKPLDEASIVGNVLRHGTGALHIDAVRIAAPGETIETIGHTPESGGREGKVYGKFAGCEGGQSAGQVLGRWPANVIIEHADDCRLVGTKEIRGANQPGKGGTKGEGHFGTGSFFGGAEGRDGSMPFYTDPEVYGMETVEDWRCVPSCPCADLDGQSGSTTSSGGSTSGRNAFGQDSGWNAHRNRPTEIVRQEDSGGASRFFHRIGGRR